MTPEEAIEKIVHKGVMPLHVWTSAKRQAKAIIDACIATAKVEAKESETRRCAARVKIWSARQRWESGLSVARRQSIIQELANDLLVTGGLEAEE